MHLSVRFSTEKELKQFQDLLYEKSGQGVSFTGLLEAMVSKVTIVTAVHNIKSNKGSKTAGVDRMKMDKYLQMPKEELFQLIQSNISNYKPKPAKRKYIEKANGKKRPLGIPTVLDRIIQECMRLILEPICEARFYPHSYGFRPYRAQKHAIRDIVNVINASVKSKDQPVWAVEGDIKGCFDNINHRLLLKKLWRIGIHDKRVLKIISQMLKAGYIDQDLYHATEMGTPQGGILSPLLSNVYLNDFDWYVGRCYMEPHRQCKHKCNDTRRLKWSGITPKYNFRYADDWVILTSTEQEAFRMKHELTKYFKHRMKLELSQEKTYVTDLRKNGIHFLGYIVKAERKRKTPDPATWSDNLVGKPFPDMERLTKKIHTLQKEVRKIGLYTQSNTQAAQIQYVNSVIMGLAQYLQPSICSHAYHAIDRRVNNTALAVWKNLFPKQYNQMQVPLKELSNLPHRHEGYDSKTFAIQIDGKWFGITYAFITHSRYESKPFDQKMTPYTEDGRRRYVNYRTKHKPLPCDRPSINTPEDIALSIYASGKGWKANFEYFMNREYAYNRDKGKCKCCGRYFSELIPKHCHHVNPRLPIERINKVPNLAWLCIPCHRMVHNSPIPPELLFWTWDDWKLLDDATVIMRDDTIKVEISKKDLTTMEELPGAELSITDKDGKEIDRWVSSDKPHYIEKLPAGTYTLTEGKAPDGYAFAESVPFTVLPAGEVQKFEMLDDVIKVEISKVDITTNKELPGAELIITNKDGKEIDRWVSTDKPHYIEKLPAGDYTLTEVKAPDGYAFAESVPFTVLPTGEVQQFEMRDDVIKVEISKVDLTTMEELPGAELTITDKDGEEIDRWVSSDKPHYIEKLPAGEYTLTEITAPDGYDIAESIRFTVLPTGEVQTVVMKDARTPERTPQPEETPHPTETPQPTPSTTPAPTPALQPIIPQTGDTFPLGLLLTVAGISLAGLAALIYKCVHCKSVAEQDDAEMK